jgi:glycosyltransferase involved in cell wall biosynthesis
VVDRAPSRLDFALRRARRQGTSPIHLGFLPLHLLYVTTEAANIAFPFWEFPDVPNVSLGENPRNNWVTVAKRLAMILTACTFTRDALRRGGVSTPVRVVPVPVSPESFVVPDWQPDQRVVIECPCYVFPQPAGGPPAHPDPWLPDNLKTITLRQRCRYWYLHYLKPRVPYTIDQALRQLVRAGRARRDKKAVLYPASPRLELSGIVYTTILNPFDPRKNFADLLTAYLTALADREDATLVVKLVVCRELAPGVLNGLIRQYQQMGLEHRCKLVFVADYLSSGQMVDLARGSTYYLNASHAEGACLPLQDAMAAGRPGIAPRHSAMLDYFDASVGLVVDSHAAPASWPHDPDERLTTSWHRIVWQSLHDRIAESYWLAKEDAGAYGRLAARGREQIEGFAGREQVWPKLAAALDEVAHESRGLSRAA